MEAMRPVFPQELQNGCKLMAAHRAYRQGAWHLLPDPACQRQQRQTPHSTISSDYSLDAVRLRFGSDVACICAHLNRQLADSKLAAAYLPLSEVSLFERLQSGVLLCSLVNVIKPGTIDESVVASATDAGNYCQKKRHNLSLAICSLEAVGISLGGLTVACLDRADCGVYVAILLQALHRCYLPDRSSAVEFQRWIRDCLGNGLLGNERAACRRLTKLASVENPQADIKAAMESIGMDGLLGPEHLEGDDNSPDDDEKFQRASLLRHLYLACMWLCSTIGDKKMIATASDQGQSMAVAAADEVSVKMWINSLGVEPPVSKLGDDLRDGLVLLQAWEALSPGSVNWPSVAMTTRAETVAQVEEADGEAAEGGNNGRELANCVLAVECARQHGLPVELALAELLAVGDLQTTLDLVLGMMRLHSLKQYRRAVGNCGELADASVAVIGWANAQLMRAASDGVGFQLIGVDDPCLRSTTVLGYLSERILISSGRLAASSSFGLGAAATTKVATGGAAVGIRRAAIPAPTVQKCSSAVPLLNTSAAVGKKMAKVVKAVKGMKAVKGLKGAKGSKAVALEMSEGDELTEEVEEEPMAQAKLPAKGIKGLKTAKGAKGLKAAPLEAEEEYTYEEDNQSLPKSPVKCAKGLKGIKGVKGWKGGTDANALAEAIAAADGEAGQAKSAKRTPPLKSAKGAKGMKAAKTVTNYEGNETEDMEPTLDAKSSVKGIKGAKGAKGLKAAKGAKGAKGLKGAKGKVALAPETEDEEAVEGFESPAAGKSPAKGVKSLKGAKGVQGAKGAKGLKGVKTQATAAEEGEDAMEDGVGEAEPASGPPLTKGKFPGKVVKKGAKAGPRLKNASAVPPRMRSSNSAASVKRVPSFMLPNRQHFSRVSTLTSSEQQADYSQQTIQMLRLCGISVLVDRLGPRTDSAIYLDVLMQLHSVSELAEAAKATVTARRADSLAA